MAQISRVLTFTDDRAKAKTTKNCSYNHTKNCSDNVRPNIHRGNSSDNNLFLKHHEA